MGVIWGRWVLTGVCADSWECIEKNKHPFLESPCGAKLFEVSPEYPYCFGIRIWGWQWGF